MFHKKKYVLHNLDFIEVCCSSCKKIKPDRDECLNVLNPKTGCNRIAATRF